MRVVCIKDFSQLSGLRGETLPIVGNIYTVREVVHYYKDRPAYRFMEIINSPRMYCTSGGNVMDECCFATRNFRPVTDISALIKLTKVRELEDV